MKKAAPFILGTVLIIAGFVVVPWLFILPTISEENPELKFVGPGAATGNFEAPGRYYLWHAQQTLFDGKTYAGDADLPSGITFSVVDSTGAALPLTSDASITSRVNSDRKMSIAYVEITEPTEVTVSAAGDFDETVFSFSRSRIGEILKSLVFVFLLAGALVLAGIGLIVWNVVKIIRSDRAAAAAQSRT